MWRNPLPTLSLFASEDPRGFQNFKPGETGVPLGSRHPGAFGYQRANHTHEGVDLYCPEGTGVAAVERGEVVAIISFTGASASPASPWWLDTMAVLVEGLTGVVVYGEIVPRENLRVGHQITAGQTLGHVTQVLIKNKGRPMTMLHLELHLPGTRDAFEWLDEKPPSLLDPTPHLLLPLTWVGRGTLSSSRSSS